MGKRGPNPGWKHTKAARQKIRESKLGRRIDAATRKKISMTMRRKWALIEALEANARATA